MLKIDFDSHEDESPGKTQFYLNGFAWLNLFWLKAKRQLRNGRLQRDSWQGNVKVDPKESPNIKGSNCTSIDKLIYV